MEWIAGPSPAEALTAETSPMGFGPRRQAKPGNDEF